MRNEKTSKRVSKIAGIILSMKVSKHGVWGDGDRVASYDKRGSEVLVPWKDIKALAASALTQTADKKPAKKIKKAKRKAKKKSRSRVPMPAMVGAPRY